MKNKQHPRLFHTIHSRLIFCFLLLFTGINILSWNSKAFTDWYRLNLFPVWTGTLGRISGMFQGSVGEILIFIGILLILLEILLLPVFLWDFARNIRQKRIQGQASENEPGSRPGNEPTKPHKLRRFRSWDVRILCWIFVYIYGTETLNCYVLYHASSIEEQYFDTDAQYGTQELVDAYAKVAAQANALAKQVKRDAQGQAVYDGTTQELYEECKKAMRAQGDAYPCLAGYYPDPKPIRASHFMSQQYLLGIYFPFTMEANYNTVMYPLNVPVTICHEFSHLKGMILEDEANYLGFTACVESDEPYLQYSGYLSVLGYLAGQVRKSVPEETRRQLESVDEQVVKDAVFLTEEQWEQVEERAVVSTETVNQATNAFLEKTLTMNGVEDGILSYSRVVRLVIHYFEAVSQ